MAVSPRVCFVNSCRISHFGMNPVSGGRPPKERRRRGVRAVRAGAFVQEVARAFIVVALLILKVKKTENVIMK